MSEVRMIDTLISEKWTLSLPEHRHNRLDNHGNSMWPYWEKERIASLHEHISPGDVVYDIGTEEGDMTSLWALWGAEVLMVEPNARVWPNIRVIWEANIGRKPLGCFVGFAGPEDVDGPLIQHDWPEEAYGPVIGDHGFCNLWERPDIARTSIDAFTDAVGPPDHITMDIEGAEFQAMKGAEKTLEVHRPKIWISVHPQFMEDMYPGDTDAGLHEYIESFGYEKHHLATDHEQHWFYEPRG